MAHKEICDGRRQGFDAVRPSEDDARARIEGQKHLEEKFNSAYQILSSMNDELYNPAL
ncbi:hypothetical protein QQ045_002714 [Rhodiola kirilowii]